MDKRAVRAESAARPGGTPGVLILAGCLAVLAWLVILERTQIERQEEIVRLLAKVDRKIADLESAVAGTDVRAAERAAAWAAEPPSPGERVSPERPGQAQAPDDNLAPILESQERFRETLADISSKLDSLTAAWAPAPDVVEPDPVPPPHFAVTLIPSASACHTGDPISVTWSVTNSDDVDTWDWIGLFATDAENSGYASYKWTEGQSSGQLSFEAPDTPGYYEFRYLIKNRNVSIPAASNPVSVVDRSGG